MSTSVGSYGSKLDFKLKQGSAFGPFTFVLKNPDDTPVDLSQITIRGQIRKSTVSSEFISFDIQKSQINVNEFSIYLSAEVTKNISCGSSPDSSYSLYLYDIELDSGLGNVTPFLYGEIRVQAEITK